MDINHSTFGSIRALSLSTEHMNKEPSLIAIPPPMCNLPYDPPHLSRWQQGSQRLQGTTNSRSGSAIAHRIDVSQAYQSTPKSSTLNNQFRALTLHPRNHCDPHRASTSRPRIINTTTYELSDDLHAKEVDLIERRYGGRLRAQHAARIIQRKYREYRMRAQYAQLRSDRRLTNRLTNGLNGYCPEDQHEMHHLTSMEDLVIDRAYVDWESEVAGSQSGGSIADITVEAKGSRSSAPSGSTQSPKSNEISSQSCSNLTTPKSHNPLQSSSPGTGTGSTSGFVSSPGSCSSGSLPTENVPTNAPVVRPSLEHQPQQPVVYYVMDGGDEKRVHQQPQQLYVAVPVRPNQQYINRTPQQQQQQRYLTQPPTATAVLVRRSSSDSNGVQTPVWCTPDGKLYTLAYTGQPATTLVVSPSSRQPIVIAPIRKEGSNGGLANPAVVVQLHNPSAAAVTPTASLVSLSPGTVITTSPTASTAVDRCRKRLYRVSLNYFNKSPVKGMDMLIKFRFLESSSRQIARFLHIRRGLARTAIGEYLGETKHGLCVATARQFIRQVDFREKEIDEALRLMMSLFRTPGESQKIVHLMTAFQLAYVEQNSTRVKAQFRNPESVMVLAYAIIMLHTDMYSPNVRPDSKMTREDFVNNLRGIDDGKDLDRNLLLAIFDRMQGGEMLVAPDHTDQVRRVHRLLTGPLRPTNLVLPQRRLVCYCRLYEVPDKAKRDRSGSHQRDVFLFNDLLLVTKLIRKRRKDSSFSSISPSTTYQVRACITLLGIRVTTFETPHYENGFSLYHGNHSSGAMTGDGEEKKKDSVPSSATRTNSQKGGGETLRGSLVISFNAKTSSDKLRLLEDIQECIMETTEMDRIRLDDVLCKQTFPTKPSDTVITVSAATAAAYGLSPGSVAPVAHSRHTRGVSYQSQLSSDITSVAALGSARGAGVCASDYPNFQHQQNHQLPDSQRSKAYVYCSHEQSR